MSDNLKEQVLEVVQNNNGIKGYEVGDELGVDSSEAYDVLEQLAHEDEVEYTAEGYEEKSSFDPFELQVKADLHDVAIPESEWGYESEYGHSRTDILEAMLPNYEIESRCTGGYQGTYVWRLDGPEYVWLLRDSYGSCELCDGLIGNDNPYGYGEQMLRNAYAFESEDDAVKFIEEVDNWRWNRVKGLAMEMLDNE